MSELGRDTHEIYFLMIWERLYFVIEQLEFISWWQFATGFISVYNIVLFCMNQVHSEKKSFLDVIGRELSNFQKFLQVA